MPCGKRYTQFRFKRNSRYCLFGYVEPDRCIGSCQLFGYRRRIACGLNTFYKWHHQRYTNCNRYVQLYSERV